MKRIEMIGSPVAHVRSPGILNPLFRANQDDLEVVTREVTAAGLADYARVARDDTGIAGLIVTTPLKQPIRDHLDHASTMVDFIGACNCVRAECGGWTGANFDGLGFVAALREVAGEIAAKRILLVGCGGAGSAIAASLVDTADLDLTINDVDAERTAAFVERLKAFAPGSSISTCAAPVGVFDIVIHATPAGMNHGDALPIPTETLQAAEVVADIVVEAGAPVKREALLLGKAIVEGDAMVAAQAELFRQFFLNEAANDTAELKT